MYVLSQTQRQSFADLDQNVVDFCKKVSKRHFFYLTFTDFNLKFLLIAHVCIYYVHKFFFERWDNTTLSSIIYSVFFLPLFREGGAVLQWLNVFKENKFASFCGQTTILLVLIDRVYNSIKNPLHKCILTNRQHHKKSQAGMGSFFLFNCISNHER